MVFTDHLPLEVVLVDMLRRNTLSLKSKHGILANLVAGMLTKIKIDEVIKKIKTIDNDIKFWEDYGHS